MPKLPASLQTIWRAAVTWWDGWLDFVMIVFVWTFAQLTIFLGPPATFGLYYVTHSMVNSGEALGVKGAIRGARTYFWKGLLWGSLNWLALILCIVNVDFYSKINSIWGFVGMVIALLLTILWLVTQFYAVPYFMEQTDKNIFLALRNGLLTALASPGYTIILMIFLGFPALIAVMGTHAVNDRLISYGKKPPDIDPREVA
jgi:hypothetical protein